MGRTKQPWPPTPSTDRGRVRVWWYGRYHHLGRADEPAVWQAEFARLLDVWRVDPGAAGLRADELLVSTLCRDYLASDAVPDGRRPQVLRALDLFAEHHGHLTATEVGPVALAAWQKGLCRLTDAAGRPTYSTTYVKMLVGVVRQAWKWAVATERLPVERWQALLTVPGPTPRDGARRPRKVMAADPKAVAAVLPHLRPGPRAMVELQRLAGFRPSELFRLTPAMVVRSGRLEVPDVGEVDVAAAKVWVVVPEKHKTEDEGKRRWIVLGRKAQKVLAPFLDRDPGATCFDPREASAGLLAERTAARVTPRYPSHAKHDARRKAKAKGRRDKSQYNRNSYNQAVRRACEKAGVPVWTPYQLRHRHAVEVDTRFGLDHVQASLGHSSPQTSRRYSKRSFTRAIDVAKGMG